MAKTKVAEESAKAKKVPMGIKEKVSVIAKQVGQNLNVVIGDEKFTRKGSKEELQPIKESIKVYDEKPTKSNYEAMMKLLRPVTTKLAVKEEQVKAEVKLTKNKAKVAEREPEAKKTKKTSVAQVVREIDEKEFSDEELKQMELAIERQKAKKAPEARTTAHPSPKTSRERY